MAQKKIQCVLHVKGDRLHDDDDVIIFNNKSWKTACDIARARKQHQKKSKYLDVCDSIDFSLDAPPPLHGYHMSCYRNFTAFHIEETKTSQKEQAIGTRSKAQKPSMVASSSTGVLKKQCIFCNSSSRKHFPHGFENLSPCETEQAQDSIINAAKTLNDDSFLCEYKNIDFVAKEVKYHNTCRKRYLANATRVQKKQDDTVKYTERRNSAFMKLISFIEAEIFIKDQPMKLLDIIAFTLIFLEKSMWKNLHLIV